MSEDLKPGDRVRVLPAKWDRTCVFTDRVYFVLGPVGGRGNDYYLASSPDDDYELIMVATRLQKED